MKQEPIMSERFNEDITRIKKPVFYKKTEVTYIAPLQPPALATFLLKDEAGANNVRKI